MATYSFRVKQKPQERPIVAASVTPVPAATATPRPILSATPKNNEPEAKPTKLPMIEVITRTDDPKPQPTPSYILQGLPVARGVFNIPAKDYHPVRVLVGINQNDVRIVGSVNVRGGQQDIWVGLLTDQELDNFVNGRAFRFIYGNNTDGALKINLPLRPGAYWLVFSNLHAQFLSKRVLADLTMFYVEK